MNDLSMLSRYRGYAISNSLDDVKRVCVGEVSSVYELIDMIDSEKKN